MGETVVEKFIRADEHCLSLARQIRDDQWSLPAAATPDWTMQQLVEHIIDNNSSMGRVLGGEDQLETKADDVPVMTLASSVQKAEQIALAETDMNRTVTTQYGTAMSVHDYMVMNLTDRTLHAWDLAVSLGLTTETAIDSADARIIYDFVAPTVEDMRRQNVFGPAVPVPDDASLPDKLLGLTGRNPAMASTPLVQG